MNYKEEIITSMQYLKEQKNTVFIGEGLINAGRIYNTLDNISLKKCLEMPIAENLIMGTSIGLTVLGYKPIVIFQRMDFMLLASDQIINHLALIPKMSGGQFPCSLIIRAIVGSQSKKFVCGEQHSHDFQHIFSPYIKTIRLKDPSLILPAYKTAFKDTQPYLIIEERDLYETNSPA